MMKTKIEPPFLRTEHNYDRNAASQETALICPEPTLAQQQFAEESDINFIADRYGLTGEIPQVLDMPKYGDFEGIFDFQSAQNAVVLAKQQFMTLPAKIRSQFHNDPQQLLNFLDNPENRDLAIAMGLVNKPTEAPQSTQGDPGAPDRANPAPEPDKRQEPAPKQTSKKDKSDT